MWLGPSLSALCAMNLLYEPSLCSLLKIPQARINHGASRRGCRDATRGARGGLFTGHHGHPACGQKCESTALFSFRMTTQNTESVRSAVSYVRHEIPGTRYSAVFHIIPGLVPGIIRVVLVVLLLYIPPVLVLQIFVVFLMTEDAYLSQYIADKLRVYFRTPSSR